MIEGDGYSPEKNLYFQGINGRSQMESSLPRKRIDECSRLSTGVNMSEQTAPHLPFSFDTL